MSVEIDRLDPDRLASQGSVVGAPNRPHEFCRHTVVRSPFGEYIRKTRLAMPNPDGGVGITQNQLSELSGIHIANLGNYELGMFHPRGSEFKGQRRNIAKGGRAEILRRALNLPEDEYYEVLEESRRSFGAKKRVVKVQKTGCRKVYTRLTPKVSDWIGSVARQKGSSHSAELARIVNAAYFSATGEDPHAA